jgi:aldehyde:ferredoxin oxidoreductase
MRGYAGKYLEIDLSKRSSKEITFSEEVLKNYIGGRGLAVKILWDRLGSKWEKVDPFSTENILLIMTGPLTGYIPGTRVCVTGKSPQSNGVIGSTVAGEFGVELKCAGYDGLIITGKAEKPSYIFICDNHVEIKDATPIWGKKGREAYRYIIKKSKEDMKAIRPNHGVIKEPAILYSGTAGDNKARVAAVISKYAHAAGYGGYGGVMGSKNLKAIAAKGFGPLPEVESMDKVKEMYQEFSKRNFQMEGFRRYGTGGGGYSTGADMSSEPVKYWQEEWHNEEGYKGDEFDKHWVKKYWGDFGCPVTCLKLAVLKTGEFKGAVCDNPDYELEAFLGPNIGVFDPEQNIYLSCLVDELGMCGIQAGSALGFAAELYEKGILTKKDLEGIDLKWGSTKSFEALMEKMALRQGIGDTLSEGVYRAAQKLGKEKGVDLTRYVVQSKGVSIGAHGVRSGKDFLSHNVSYAVSVQGGDHTSASNLPLDDSELSTIFADSSVYCFFTTFAIEDKELFNLYEAITGWNLPEEEWYNMKGLRILALQRTMLLLGGPDAKWKPGIDDDNPPKFWEPLPSGPDKGAKLDRSKFEKDRADYFAAVGWDQNGVPTSDTLKRLGLENVEPKLSQVSHSE